MEFIIPKLIVGFVIGLLAGIIMKKKQGIIRNIITGMAGAVVGPWLMNFLGISITAPFVNAFVVPLIGACVVIFLIRLVW